MNALQVKTFLWKNGLTVTSIARDIELEYDATFESLRKMLTDMFYYGKFNEKLAQSVYEKYGLRIVKTSRPQTVKEAVRQAA